MIKISLFLLFLNIIFTLAFISIFITFAMFISYDKQKTWDKLQNRYELIAEKLLKGFPKPTYFWDSLAL